MVTFLDIMEYTIERIYNEITLLPSLQICCCYNKGHDDQNKVELIGIRCSNCGKQTGLSMENMNTKYKDIITSFVLNITLHHVGIT